MQWSADNTPSTIQGKSLKLRELFAKAANAALAKGFSKEESIFAGTNAVKIEERKNQPAKVKSPKLPSHVEALRSYNNPFEVVSKAEEIPTISNSITSADFDSEGHLILSMSDGKKIKTKNKAVEQNIEQNIAIAPNVQLFSSNDSVSITQDGQAFDITTSGSNIDVISTDGTVTVSQTGQVFDLSASTSGSVNLTSSDGSIVISGTDGSYDLAVSAASPASTLVVQVRNQTGATLTKGTAVYISGASGNKPLVSKALATSDATSAQTLGLITADITTNQNGYVTIIGVVSGLNTSAFSEGVQLYLSPTVAGTYTATKPHAPNHLVYVGVVTRSHQNQGTVEVKVQNGYELDEIHDVQIVNPTNGQIIAYDSSTQLWKNVNAPSSSGVISVSGTGNVSGLTLSGTVTSTGDITLSGQLEVLPSDFQTQDANLVLASPNSTSGKPTFRSLVTSDIPNLDASKITSGIIDAARLPGYVDDVVEFANLSSFPSTGETAKLYVALDTNKVYRWSGSTYIFITSGAVDSVAGKTGIITLTNSDVGLNNVENKSSSTIRSEITSTNVTTALGFTPYDATNPNAYITSTGSISGNAATATSLQTARTINGVSFDGTENINIATKLPILNRLNSVINVTITNAILAVINRAGSTINVAVS